MNIKDISFERSPKTISVRLHVKLSALGTRFQCNTTPITTHHPLLVGIDVHGLIEYELHYQVSSLLYADRNNLGGSVGNGQQIVTGNRGSQHNCWPIEHGGRCLSLSLVASVTVAARPPLDSTPRCADLNSLKSDIIYCSTTRVSENPSFPPRPNIHTQAELRLQSQSR